MDSASPEGYSDVFDSLARDGVRYVVTSGVAVVLHGHPRPVADLDIVVDPASEEAALALASLVRTGFVPSLPLPLSMVSVMRMFDQAQREVDLFVRYHIPFGDLWAAAESRRVGSSDVRVISLEHLLWVKRLNGRPHDLLDVSALLALGADGPGRAPG